MFVIGCLVGYFIVFPLIFRFLITFELSDAIENMISLDSYMSNFYTLILIMGVVLNFLCYVGCCPISDSFTVLSSKIPSTCHCWSIDTRSSNNSFGRPFLPFCSNYSALFVVGNQCFGGKKDPVEETDETLPSVFE